MGTIANPFQGLIEGVLQGHAIATQLRNQAMQEEAFQRAQQRDADERQLHFLTLQQQLEQSGARRVMPGTNAVQDSFQATSPGAAPGLTDTSQTITGPRPVDKSRVITARDPNTGQQVQWETPSLQDQMNRALTMRRLEAEATGEAGAQSEIYKRRALQSYRETAGFPVPDLVVRAGLAAPGEKRLPEEMQGLVEAAQKILSPEYKEVAPGGTMMSIPRPSPFGTNAPMVNTLQDQQPQQPRPDVSQVGLPPAVMPGISTPGRPSFLPGNAVAPQAGVNPIAAAAAPSQQARAQFVANAKAAGQGIQTPQAPAQPEGPKVLFTAGLKPEGDFQMVYLPQYAKSLGKTVDQLTKDDIAGAKTEWTKASKNPVELAMEQARLGIEQNRLQMERRAQGLDPSGNPLQYRDAQGNPINISADQRLVAAYKMPPTSARQYLTNPAFMEGVTAINPAFDVGRYEQRQKTMNDLTPGGPLGQNALALNTLVRHSDDMMNTIALLKNGSFTPANEAYQRVRQLFGSAAPTNFDQLKNYVVGETVKLIRAGGGTEGDEKRVSDALNRAGSPQQLAEAMRINFEVAGGKMQALNQAVRPVINDPAYSALDPGATAILIRRGYEAETMKPRAAGGPKLGDRQTHQGRAYVFDGTKWVGQ
jgi:hypothetical protein